MNARAPTIVGAALSDYPKAPHLSERQHHAQALTRALDDAGLTPADVDGMSTYTIDNNEDVDLIRSLGIPNVRFSSRVGHGGGGSVGPIAHAMAAVDAGLANVVVCWRAMNERSEYRFGTSQMDNTSSTPGAGTGFIEWSLPFGCATPAAWIPRYWPVSRNVLTLVSAEMSSSPPTAQPIRHPVMLYVFDNEWNSSVTGRAPSNSSALRGRYPSNAISE